MQNLFTCEAISELYEKHCTNNEVKFIVCESIPEYFRLGTGMVYSQPINVDA